RSSRTVRAVNRRNGKVRKISIRVICRNRWIVPVRNFLVKYSGQVFRTQVQSLNARNVVDDCDGGDIKRRLQHSSPFTALVGCLDFIRCEWRVCSSESQSTFGELSSTAARTHRRICNGYIRVFGLNACPPGVHGGLLGPCSSSRQGAVNFTSGTLG